MKLLALTVFSAFGLINALALIGFGTIFAERGRFFYNRLQNNDLSFISTLEGTIWGLSNVSGLTALVFPLSA
jgi:hypothetical protein